ncbi:MAG: hypothetical protein AAGM21_14605 [Pseudomonadota bacterium]
MTKNLLHQSQILSLNATTIARHSQSLVRGAIRDLRDFEAIEEAFEALCDRAGSNHLDPDAG